MEKKIKVQMIGNYLEALKGPLRRKGILFDSTINACNPLAMEGKRKSDNLKYCNDINHMPTLLNIRKNLSQMLSRNPENFNQNYNLQPRGVEVRYKNDSDYIIIYNTVMGYALFEKDGTVYSDTWPQNQFINDIKADTAYKRHSFPFTDDFNWKYYYDKFINAVLNEYDSQHIILIKINSAQWYMDGTSIKAFDGKSSLYRNRIEQMDEYFIRETHCLCINERYNYIPPSYSTSTFPFASSGDFSDKKVADNILEIINGNAKKYEPHFHRYDNRLAALISNKFCSEIYEENIESIEIIEKSWLSLDKLCSEDNDFYSDVLKLKDFLSEENICTLSDYALKLLNDESELNDKVNIDLIELYTRYMKLNINDIIAVYMIYSKYDNKGDFKAVVRNITRNTDCLPVIAAKEFKQKNLDYLKTYPCIQSDLLQDIADKNIFIRLENNCFILLSPNDDHPMDTIHLDIDETVNYTRIIDSGYACSIEQADSLCSNLSFYVEKARRGEGKTPIKIKFDSTEEFKKYINLIDFSDLLETEQFVLCLSGSDYSVTDYKPKTDLSFLFKKGTMLCHLSSGLADQISYYLVAKRAQEENSGEVYFDDIPIIKNYAFNGTEELMKIINEDISERLFSNIFNKKLISELIKAEKTPDVLYQSGCKHLVVVSSDKRRMTGVNLCNRLFYTSTECMNDFFSYNFDLTYYLSLIRPERMMINSNFNPLNYISFPEYDTDENLKIAEQMNNCDAVAIHIRRGDFITFGITDDMDFYKESLEKLKEIPDYSNKKFFIFSDDIPWCKSHLDEIGFTAFPNADITFVDHNKGADSYRDMQLMTEAKIHIGGSSGFSHVIPVLSRKNEVYMQYNLPVMEIFKKAGKINKYDIGKYSKAYRTNWGSPTPPPPTPQKPKADTSAKKAEPPKAQVIKSFSDTNLLRLINRIASIGGSVFDYFIDKGINQVNLYGNDELIALLYEQAVLKGMQINKCFSDKMLEYNINMLDKHLKVGDKDTIAPKQIKTISENTDDNNIPTVILEKTSKTFSHAYTIESLLNYSSLMQRLFRTVFEYKKQHAPKLKVVIVQFPSLRNVQNKNEYENSLIQNTNTVNPFNKSGYDDEFEKDVHWRFPGYYKGETPMLVDHASKNLNIVAGHRVTVGIPENAAHTIFVFGPSYVFGYKTDDKHTIASCIQRELNQYYNEKSPYQILNCSFAGGENFIAMRKSFLAHQPQNGDVAVFFYRPNVSLLKDVFGDEFYYFTPQNEQHIFDRPHDYGEYMFADSVHLMPAGNNLLGKAVAKDLIDTGLLKEDALAESVNNKIPIKNKDDESLPEPLLEYLNSIDNSKAVIGAIVMNCNPFTLGHRYLIEHASKKCDKLYVFAVEEDLSFFPFADRIELIRKGVADLKNVTVLPSGNFIISRTTFPAYFEKEAITEDAVIDASSDIEIFAKHIAPSLNISIRFAGEEPLDNVTRQYNAQMKTMLPRYGIDFEVIPRKEINGEVVSASRVRKLLKESNFDEIGKIVPDTTLEYLKNKFGN